MLTQTDDVLSERGGIAVRDYTQGGRMPARGQGGRALALPSRLKPNFSRLARRLGWFSVALGALQLLMPDRVQRLAGVRGDHRNFIRAVGLRELTHGLLIFMQPRPTTGVWSRVVGDAMDLAALGFALSSPCNKRERLGPVTAAIAGITALDALTAVQLGRKRAEGRRQSVLTKSDLNSRARSGAFHVMKSITINRSPETLYQFWRNFENLPQFMYHLKEVRVIDERRSHWAAKAPAGMQVEWEAEITDDRPNELIAWRSLPNAEVPNSGMVTFEPGPAGRGTVVRVELEYRPPGGKLGQLVARLFGEEPVQQVAGDLRRFKQVMEVGEVVRSEGSPQGFGQKRQRPARPFGRGTNGEKRSQPSQGQPGPEVPHQQI